MTSTDADAAPTRKIVANYGKTYHPVLDPTDARLFFHLTEETAQN